MNRLVDSIVCDAGPLIHLDELGCLSLLNDFNQILVPGQVWQEVTVHRPQALTHSEISLQRIDIVISPEPTFQTLVQTLAL
jgi:predicted nucleic acid-binding protein